MCCTDKGQATLSLGMDLNLDWMTLDDFQKHLNGEDEILSGPPLSPSEYFHLHLRQLADYCLLTDYYCYLEAFKELILSLGQGCSKRHIGRILNFKF